MPADSITEWAHETVKLPSECSWENDAEAAWITETNNKERHLSNCPQKTSPGSHVGIPIREKNCRAGVS